MKKVVKNAFSFVAILATVSVIVFSCNKPANSLHGKWELFDYKGSSFQAVALVLAIHGNLADSSEKHIYVDMYKDGTSNFSVNDSVFFKFNYKILEKDIVFSSNKESDTLSIIKQLDDSLVVVRHSEKDTLYFFRKSN